MFKSPLVTAEEGFSPESNPSLSSPSNTLIFETPLVTENLSSRLQRKRMESFNLNRPGVTMVEIGSIKSKITRQLGIFEKRKESIEETMQLLRQQLHLDEFSKEYEQLHLDFDVLSIAVKIVNENLVAGDQRCAALSETDKPRASWEEYRLERTDTLCELEELHLMVKRTLDRTVERSSARRISASRSDGYRPSSIQRRGDEPDRPPTRLESRKTPPQLEPGLETTTTTSETRRRELEESFSNYEHRVASENLGPRPMDSVPTFDVRLDKGHFKLTLPTFDGKHWDWDRFWSQYVLHIDSQGYPNSVKLNILRSHLSGEALDILDAGSQDGTDLEGGKRALKFHYDNEAVKKAAILSKLEGIPRATNSSLSLSRTFTDLKRLIKSLARYEEVNTAHMRRCVRQRLPKEAVVDLKRREDVTGREWSTDELLDAVESYISTRRLEETHDGYEKVRFSAEAVSETKGESGRNFNSSISRSSFRKSEPTVKPTIDRNSIKCTLCGLPNHKADFCRRTTVEQVEQAIRENNLCRQCLLPGHRAFTCTANPCSSCGGRHNLKLCRVQSGGASRGGGNQSGNSSGQFAESSTAAAEGRGARGGLNYAGGGNRPTGNSWNGRRGNTSHNNVRGQDSFRSQEGS